MSPSASSPPLAASLGGVLRRLLGEQPGPLVVATSGGADSSALAALAATADLGPLILAYVDHGWRGAEESARDRVAVASLAGRLGARMVALGPPPADTPRTEDAARRFRYGALERAARSEGARFVLVGHHAGDQAETLIARTLRGSGLIGMTGIPTRRPLGREGIEVVRPLLEVAPAELRRWLEGQGIPWREDPTNTDLSKERNEIRARLARLGERRAHVQDWLTKLAARLRQRLDGQAARLIQSAAPHVRTHPLAGAMSISREWLAGLPTPLSFGLALRHAGQLIHADRDGPWTTSRHRTRMWALVRSGGDIDLPRGLRFHVAGKRAWLAYRSWEHPRLPVFEMEQAPSASFDLAAYLAAGGDRSAVVLSADQLGPSPRLRWLRRGDTFEPFGRGAAGPVDIHAWMSRRGLPLLARRGALVLEGAQGIAWLVGERIDAQYAVTPRTERVARIRLPKLTNRPASSRHHPSGRSAPS